MGLFSIHVLLSWELIFLLLPSFHVATKFWDAHHVPRKSQLSKLCNGTFFVMKQFLPYVIETSILTVEKRYGECVHY